MVIFTTNIMEDNNLKKVFSVILCLSIIFTSFSASSFASTANDQIFKVTAANNRVVTFKISSELTKEIGQERLRSIMNDLANENTDTSSITILNFGLAKPNQISSTKNSAQYSKTALAGYTTIGPVVKTYATRNVLESDRFMASCAKGQTKTVTTTITSSLSSTYSNIPVGTGLELNGTISSSISVGTTLTGPPEGSPYNTREYRTKFYQNTGDWVQINWLNGNPITLRGTFKEAAYYTDYSKDTSVR